MSPLRPCSELHWMLLLLVIWLRMWAAIGQHALANWAVPDVIRPVRSVHAHANITLALRRVGFITLHVPEGYYPDAFFLFIHVPKAGGTTFNVRSCPVVLQECGQSCGCGNCGLPFFNSGSSKYPVLHDLMSGTCPILSYEMNYDGFHYAFNHPIPFQGRPIYMLTMIRKPVSLLYYYRCILCLWLTVCSLCTFSTTIYGLR